MATTQSLTSTYAGEDSSIYISAAIKAANTIESDVLTVLPNVKYKSVIHKLALGDNVHDFTCDFVASGSVTLTEKILEPKKLQVSSQLCKNDFLTAWEAATMGYGSNNENLPVPFEEYFIARVIEKTAVAIDTNIWLGSSATTGKFQGLITSWEADASTNEVTASAAGVVDNFTSSIDATNVIEILGAIYDRTPDAVMAADDFKFVVSLKTSKAYARALSALGFRRDYNVGEKPLDFEGIPLVVLNNAPANFIATFNKSNVYFGTGILNDSNELSILDMHEHDLSDNIRFKLAFTGDTEYVNSDEITYWYKA